ncbi:uncharacterized protein LOC126891305 [Diabrotica virgifera virgifera]|uniref:Uncharacterized protein n=1 Tax=Diabrotica virgifera virgifera TaxID=50390 RepID=A0ABM5L1X4_DIAVI|nr:uncharacterized protein LOC126891305 [Diabrotica virgifera virgifera]
MAGKATCASVKRAVGDRRRSVDDCSWLFISLNTVNRKNADLIWCQKMKIKSEDITIEAMRRLREARKKDPELYEEEKRKERERWKRRKEQGKIKNIDQMTDREKRKQRKKWRESSKQNYDKTKQAKNLLIKLSEESPPPSPVPEQLLDQAGPSNQNEDGRVREGRLRRRRKLEKLNKEILSLKMRLKIEENKKLKYKQKVKRLKSKYENTKPTPIRNVENLLEKQKVSPAVKRRLVFGEVLKKQLTENYKEKIHIRNIIHQQRTIKAIKTNLRSDEVLIHLDFSENYNCKYNEEVQSAHFGGSKPQLSLHTVVTRDCNPVWFRIRPDPVGFTIIRPDPTGLAVYLIIFAICGIAIGTGKIH